LDKESVVLKRLEEEIDWYSRRSESSQTWFKRLKAIELVAAALIPFLAGLKESPFLVGALGVLIVVLESLQGLYQFQSNWITYRSACEALKHEKYLWMAGAGPYADPEDPDRLLAEREESLIPQEHAKWTSIQETIVKRSPEQTDRCQGEGGAVSGKQV